MGWAGRETLSTLVRPGKARGLLTLGASADVVVGLAADELDKAGDVTRRHLREAGIGSSDRVLLALNNDGAPGAWELARAIAGEAEAVSGCGPRGRMRLLRAINAVQPTVLVMTPTGAMDFLSRLHIEFLVDPLELGVERIILVGELASAKTEERLAAEFGARVGWLWCDPFFGVALAHGDAKGLVVEEDLVLGRLGADETVLPADVSGDAPAELVLQPSWSTALASASLRTGWVVTRPAEGDRIPLPTATVGNWLMIRGQWLSVSALSLALRTIEGIDAWSLVVEREGTLDQARLQVAFSRPSLTENPMWSGRLREALRALTPIDIEVEIQPAADQIG